MDFSVGTPGEEIGRAGSSPASHTVRNPLSPKKPPPRARIAHRVVHTND